MIKHKAIIFLSNPFLDFGLLKPSVSNINKIEPFSKVIGFPQIQIPFVSFDEGNASCSPIQVSQSWLLDLYQRLEVSVFLEVLLIVRQSTIT